jgi:hypothetical protein
MTVVATHMETYAFISKVNDTKGNSVSNTSYLAADADSAYSQGSSSAVLRDVPLWPGIAVSIDQIVSVSTSYIQAPIVTTYLDSVATHYCIIDCH